MAANDWKLPEPVFRTTDGQRLSGVPSVPDHSNEPDDSPTNSESGSILETLYAPPVSEPKIQPAALPMDDLVIEEQPYISEQLTADRIQINEASHESVIEAPSSRSHWVAIVAIFLLLIALLSILLYILFIRTPPDTTF